MGFMVAFSVLPSNAMEIKDLDYCKTGDTEMEKCIKIQCLMCKFLAKRFQKNVADLTVSKGQEICEWEPVASYMKHKIMEGKGNDYCKEEIATNHPKLVEIYDKNNKTKIVDACIEIGKCIPQVIESRNII